MSPFKYNTKHGIKELSLRILPPKEQAIRIKATPTEQIKNYGKAYIPFGLIQMFRSRIAEIQRDGLSDYEQGRLYVVENKQDDAESCFEKALQAGDERACANLGIIKEMRSDLDKAFELFQRGKDSASKNNLGAFYEKYQNDIIKAEQCYDKAARMAIEEKNSKYGAILINGGRMKVRMGDVQFAALLFRRATQCGYYEGYMEAFKLAAELGCWNDVQAILLEASQKGYGPAIIQSALMLLEQGEEAKAKDMFSLAEDLGYELTQEQKRIVLTIRTVIKVGVGTA